MNGIYFFHLIFFPVVFSKQTLTQLPRNVFLVKFRMIISETWVSKLVTEDTSFHKGSVIFEHFEQCFLLSDLLIPELQTRWKICLFFFSFFTMQSIRDMHDKFYSLQKCSSLQWGIILLKVLQMKNFAYFIE